MRGFERRDAATLATLVMIGMITPSVEAEPTPINPDRRDFTTGTGIVAPGWLQLESGVTAERSPSTRDASLGELTLRVPLARPLELQLGVPSFLVRHAQRTSSGVGDADLALRYKFLDSGVVDVALQLSSILPTGDRSVAEHRWQPAVILASSIKLSQAAELVMSVGGRRAAADGQVFSQGFMAASLRVALGDAFSLFTEAYAFNREERDGDAQRFVAVGGVWWWTPDLALDGRIGKGIDNADGVDLLASVGLSRRF